MKSNSINSDTGFSLIATMIALVITSLLIAGMSELYANITATSKENQSRNLLIIRSSMSIFQLVNDIQHSGSFGCFNARIVGNLAGTESIPSSIISPAYGKFDTMVQGLVAFTSANIPSTDSTALNSTDDSLISGSDILKLQYAENFAFVSGTTLSSGNIAVINVTPPHYFYSSGLSLNQDSTIKYALDPTSTSNSLYMLASCNRIDQIQGALSGGNLLGIAISNQAIPPSSHDNSSWRLMNFVTRYYYVANPGGVTGLYTKFLQADGSLSVAQLVLSGAQNIMYSFEVESMTTNSSQIKNTAIMLSTDWKNIKQVIFTLQLNSPENYAINTKPLSESITQSVLLR